MKSVLVTIEDVEYRFIPGKCEIYPVVSTDVIVQRWVDECVDLSLESGNGMDTDTYLPSYQLWGGSLTRIELNNALKRLGHEVGAKIMIKTEGGRPKYKQVWRWASLK